MFLLKPLSSDKEVQTEVDNELENKIREKDAEIAQLSHQINNLKMELEKEKKWWNKWINDSDDKKFLGYEDLRPLNYSYSYDNSKKRWGGVESFFEWCKKRSNEESAGDLERIGWRTIEKRFLDGRDYPVYWKEPREIFLVIKTGHYYGDNSDKSLSDSRQYYKIRIDPFSLDEESHYGDRALFKSNSWLL